MSYTPRIMTEAGDMDGIRVMARMNERELSDADILSPGLLPGVEARVILSLPGYASLGADYTAILRSAVTKITAAWALASQPESEKSLDYDQTRKREEQVSRLLSEAKDDLGLIPGSEPSFTTPDLLRVAGPTRTAKTTEQNWFGWIYPV